MATSQLIKEPPASFWTRFAAQLIDAIVITAVSLGISRLSRGAVAIALPWVLTAAYYSLCEGLAERTLGKRLLAIKVVDDVSGQRIGPPRALLRFVFSWVSFICLLAGYLWMFGNDAGQTWHDQVARSLVIRS